LVAAPKGSLHTDDAVSIFGKRWASLPSEQTEKLRVALLAGGR
jgi:hypothetical protein